jgi:hypothetical protein
VDRRIPDGRDVLPELRSPRTTTRSPASTASRTTRNISPSIRAPARSGRRSPRIAATGGTHRAGVRRYLTTSRVLDPTHHVIAVLGGMMGLRASEMATLTVESLGIVRGYSMLAFVGTGPRPARVPVPTRPARASRQPYTRGRVNVVHWAPSNHRTCETSRWSGYQPADIGGCADASAG